MQRDVVARDRFVLTGVAAAIITVRLNLSMTWVADPSGRMAWAGVGARLTVGDQTVEDHVMGPFLGPSIELDVVVIEGVPFVVVYQAAAYGWGYDPTASITCELEFVGVPEAAVMTSCNGYGGAPVPVDDKTWGAVKALYR